MAAPNPGAASPQESCWGLRPRPRWGPAPDPARAPPQTSGAASPQECCWGLRPRPRWLLPPPDPLLNGIWGGAPKGSESEPQRGSRGRAPSKRMLSCFAKTGQYTLQIFILRKRWTDCRVFQAKGNQRSLESQFGLSNVGANRNDRQVKPTMEIEDLRS